MSRTCDITSKKALRGNKVSHAQNKSLRRFEVNLQRAHFYSETIRRNFSVRLAASTIRLIDKKGGFDEFLLASKPAALNVEMRRVRRQILSARAG